MKTCCFDKKKTWTQKKVNLSIRECSVFFGQIEDIKWIVTIVYNCLPPNEIEFV